MIQGVNKEYIFEKDEYIETFLKILKKYTLQYNITIISFCIMNNHAHILVYLEDIQDVSKLMQKINMIYAQFYNNKKERCGVVFRNRYQSEPIFDINHLVNCINYIHLNPVKAKIVKNCEDYKYSSYKDYMNNSGVTKNKVLKKIFGENYDYSNLLKMNLSRKFIDVNKTEDEEMKNIIDAGIIEFNLLNEKELGEILSNRETLKKLIKYLKYVCRINYTEIMKRLEINKGIMNKLK